MCMARAYSGRSVGLLGHTQRKALNLSLADQRRQRDLKEGGHGLCRIRSIDWRKKGSLRASRCNRAALDQVLLCVLTGTSTEQIGNAHFLKQQQPYSTACLPECIGQSSHALVYQAAGRKANSPSTSLHFRSRNVILRFLLKTSVTCFICPFPW